MCMKLAHRRNPLDFGGQWIWQEVEHTCQRGPEEAVDPVEELRMRLQDINNVGYSQRAMSRDMAVPRSTLQDFMSGRVEMPRPETLVKIASWLEGI